MSILKALATNKLKLSLFIISFILFIVIMGAATFKISPLTWNIFNSVNIENDIAIKSADPVAYFKQQTFSKGIDTYSTQYKNVTWKFSSEANKAAFIASPEKYIPQYGGYCATAVSKNLTADINPQYWLVINNKLYLFFNEDAQKEWSNLAKEDSILIADKNWTM